MAWSTPLTVIPADSRRFKFAHQAERFAPLLGTISRSAFKQSGPRSVLRDEV